jgi:hypothetical protein
VRLGCVGGLGAGVQGGASGIDTINTIAGEEARALWRVSQRWRPSPSFLSLSMSTSIAIMPFLSSTAALSFVVVVPGATLRVPGSGGENGIFRRKSHEAESRVSTRSSCANLKSVFVARSGLGRTSRRSGVVRLAALDSAMAF